MSEHQQLDLFGESVSDNPKQAPKKSREAPKASVSVRKDTRPGVCECGSGGFTSSVHKSLWIRKCMKCGHEMAV